MTQIQPDLITLTDGFVGTLAPHKSGLLEGATAEAVPMYSRLSRLDRLKASGKAGTEVEEEVEETQLTQVARGKKEKLKQRGKGKSLKRCDQEMMRVNPLADIVVQVPAEEEKERYRSKYCKPEAFLKELSDVDGNILP